MKNGTIPRRKLLRSVGVLGASVTAGCLSLLDDSKTRIAEIVLINLDGTGHSVELRIERSSEEVFRTERAVPADGPQPVLTADNGIPTERGEYTITASLDGGVDEIRRTYPDAADGDCYSVTVQIDSDGSFRGMPTDPSSDRC